MFRNAEVKHIEGNIVSLMHEYTHCVNYLRCIQLDNRDYSSKVDQAENCGQSTRT